MSKDLRKSENGLSQRLITHVENLHEIFPMNDGYCFQTVTEIVICCAGIIAYLPWNIDNPHLNEFLVRIFIEGKMRTARRS